MIGKDVLELLSSAMYVDPLCIYREYIQNATDAIDEARAIGLYKGGCKPRIDVTLDLRERSIKIRDNGTGIPPNLFARRLTALGASKKRGSKARGFRGVGRLAGLAYCQRLIFRAKAKGTPHVWEIHWDCMRLKTLLRDHNYKGDIHDIMSAIVDFEPRSSDGFPEHFFEVELIGVNRIRNDVLLNETVVEQYLAEVAPAPFAETFAFGAEITARLGEHGVGNSYNIFVSGRSERICRPFKNAFEARQGVEDTFDGLEFFQLPGIDGEIVAVGWLLHHSYGGALPDRTGIKGLRMRAGNVQIGDNRIFDAVFPEPRFNAWTVGEVHLLSDKLVPNGRRDDLEQNIHHQNLLSHLTPLGRRLAKLCRESSARRNARPVISPRGGPETPLTIPADHTLAWAAIPSLKLHLQSLPPHKRQIYDEVLHLLARWSPPADQSQKLIRRLLARLTALARQ